MERKEYLEWCRDCAMLPEGMYGVRRKVPEKRKVIFRGITYYPQGYYLDFDRTGAVRHTAVLHGLTANSIVYAPLQDVKKYLVK